VAEAVGEGLLQVHRTAPNTKQPGMFRENCNGFNNIDKSKPVDVVFWKTPHYVQGGGRFRTTGAYSSYCTFHQNGNYALFISHESTDCVTEVIKY
jgi:hypothetical protein